MSTSCAPPQQHYTSFVFGLLHLFFICALRLRLPTPKPPWPRVWWVCVSFAVFAPAGTVPSGEAPLSVEDLTHDITVDQDGCGPIGGIL